MSDHPSLNLPFVFPEPLNPQRTMDPYAPCWCGSGSKWRWCHKDRERQPPIELYERLAKMRETFVQGYCSHPSAAPSTCSDEIVRAHTVQRRGGLAAIAENGHVIAAKSAAEDLHKNAGQWILREVGVRSASTFHGFCGQHDGAMFRPIEAGPFTLSRETAFLLSFRALAYEMFMKRVALLATKDEREADRGHPFEVQCEVQNWIYAHQIGLRRALADLERWKRRYDAAYLAGQYDGFDFYALGFANVLPFAGCGGFHPEFDFAGQPLQLIGRGDLAYEHVTLNITVMDGRSVAVIGWNEGMDGPAAKFARSLTDVPDSEKAEAVRRVAFEQIENVYMTPSWWRALPEDRRGALVRRMRTGLAAGPERQASCLLADGLQYFNAVAVEEVSQSW